jgi:hypothetical protein
MSVVGTIAATLVLGALLLSAVSHPVPTKVARFELSSPLALDHHVRAIARILPEAPGLGLVELILAETFALDDAGLCSMAHIHDLLRGAGVSLSISAAPNVRAVLLTRGLPATEGPPRSNPPMTRRRRSGRRVRRRGSAGRFVC